MNNNISRRQFLKHLAQLGAAYPLGLNLMTAANAAELEEDDGYKAIVCYYLAGGCDQFNTLVPYDTTSYNSYATTRESIALPYNEILPINITQGLPDGIQMALHPNLGDLQTLINNNKVAIIQNIGSLVEPTSLQQYIDRSVALPPELFSHAGQNAYWQTLSSDKSAVGWGGKIGDLLSENNNDIVFTNISTGVDSVDLANGTLANKYSMGTNGPIQFKLSTQTHNRFSTVGARDKILEMITKPRTHLLEDEISSITERSISAEESYRSAVEAIDPISTDFSYATILQEDGTERKLEEESASKLRVMANTIAANADLGVRRQVFFVPVGGFDNHDNLLENHGNLMETINRDISSFQRAMEEIGMSDNVTMMVASEFGRTLTSNGDGSDHGWGGNAYLIGGAVKGGFYGETPKTELNSDIDVGKGRLLPTTPIESMSITLSRWFGVPDGDLADLFPNSTNFATNPADLDLGILS